ncbi:inactive protein RESTRICTED TEV MOVEMENT 2-like [Abrus precatorius]|uniref:Inactive protein RESTRICTED TEV MOVEMENT 2-like n=1 Tax=Abrus precatorius TaxID=3816 RepID=A0A8B8L480_ABRPR|nr:inactive protein RESTRICTED TEV MOVEMENT 2-like [Abrus precatorius]
MESKHSHTPNRSYEDFDPLFTWHREEARDTLELHLPGFRRDQIRIQINHLGFLVISGERPLDGTRWKRFKKEFEIPTYCNEDAIHGNLMQSILSVVMPKKSPQLQQERKFPQTQHEKEKKTYQNKEFEGRGTNEDTEFTAKEGIQEHTHHTREYQSEENNVNLTPETTREVAFKFMVVIIMILVIASYLADISKNLVAHAQSYFHN